MQVPDETWSLYVLLLHVLDSWTIAAWSFTSLKSLAMRVGVFCKSSTQLMTAHNRGDKQRNKSCSNLLSGEKNTVHEACKVKRVQYRRANRRFMLVEVFRIWR